MVYELSFLFSFFFHKNSYHITSYKWIYVRSCICSNCGERYEDKIDHCSYAHNLIMSSQNILLHQLHLAIIINDGIHNLWFNPW